jgi:hypothetical protein
MLLQSRGDVVKALFDRAKALLRSPLRGFARLWTGISLKRHDESPLRGGASDPPLRLSEGNYVKSPPWGCPSADGQLPEGALRKPFTIA